MEKTLIMFDVSYHRGGAAVVHRTVYTEKIKF
jgi:hypothetical protein